MSLRRLDIPMDRFGFDNYYVPAAEAITGKLPHGRGLDNSVYNFDALLGVQLGCEWITRPAEYDKPLPDDWKEFLTQLAGPYGVAILKAYRIKYKLERSDG